MRCSREVVLKAEIGAERLRQPRHRRGTTPARRVAHAATGNTRPPDDRLPSAPPCNAVDNVS
jgi:hypothetical protein